ncbi:MAG: Alpha/beta hydrolase [Candidatus Angelobacter sp.]|nr:Alpha/beta hydrolase [Candidatus Angelobacter sp.]
MQQETDKPVQSFVPRRGFRNAHAQTLAGNFFPRTNILPAPEERLFQVEEEAQVLCHCHWQPGDRRQNGLTVVIVHGLEGSSESQYVLGTGSKAWRAGMNVVRMNMRNCGGTEELTPTLYHSGLSMDVGAVARTLVEQDSLKHIALVGYSMGGNLVLKLAGEWGRGINEQRAPKELIAVAGVSPAMDLAPSADALHDLQNRMYEWKFMRGLRNRFRRKAALFPDRYDLRYLQNLRTIREFDDQITARYSGFTSADDYYTRSSSSRSAEFIAVPALVIHSTDDPFIRMTPETRAKLLANPHVTFIETEHGGHCAFLADANGYDGRWAEKQVIEFFEKQMAGCQ